MGLLHLYCQLLLPCVRNHRRSESPDTDSVVEDKFSQSIVANPLQREAKLLIILFGNMISIVLQQFSVEPPKYLFDNRKFFYQHRVLL